MSNSDSPEYQVILKSNHLSVEVDNEVFILHKVFCHILYPLLCIFNLFFVQFVKDHYAPRFPELDSIVANPIDYCKAVQAIGNPEVIY